MTRPAVVADVPQTLRDPSDALQALGGLSTHLKHGPLAALHLGLLLVLSPSWRGSLTQLITILTDGCVVHVSDRLLSRRSATGYKAFDHNSNKAVVFQARDGHAVVAYTGLAYVKSLPTDQFIVHSLMDTKLLDGGFMSNHDEYMRNWLDMGRSIDRLLLRFQGIWPSLSRGERTAEFEVTIGGWRLLKRKEGIVAPFLWSIEKLHGPDSPFVLKRHSRLWEWDRKMYGMLAPNVGNEVTDAMMSRLHRARTTSLEAIDDVLLETMSQISAQRPGTVGRSYLRVCLWPYGTKRVSYRLVVGERDKASGALPHSGFSPWLICPPSIWYPTEMSSRQANSSWEAISGGYSWAIDGAPTPSSANTVVNIGPQIRKMFR